MVRYDEGETAVVKALHPRTGWELMPRIMKTTNTVLAILSLAALGCSPSQTDSNASAKSPASAPLEQHAGTDSAPSETSAELARVEIPNATLSQGVLSGGQPAAEQYVTLAEAGYKTVIDLRATGEAGSEENASRVQAAGMTHVHIPVAGAEGINRESAQKLADALAQADGPIVVHCGSGNRVGALFGMKAFWIEGKTPEEALAIAQAAGLTGLEAHVKTLLGLAQ